MDCKTKIKELREMTGMNRKDFCKFFHIPYRTVTEWELDNRHAPEYVLRPHCGCNTPKDAGHILAHGG